MNRFVLADAGRSGLWRGIVAWSMTEALTLAIAVIDSRLRTWATLLVAGCAGPAELSLPSRH